MTTLERRLELRTLDVHGDYVCFEDPSRPRDPLMRFAGSSVSMSVDEWTSLGKPLRVTLAVAR
jgi:hypothetical protein